MNLLSVCTIFARVGLLAFVLVGCAERQKPASDVALVGTVSSSQETLMEGVVVILRGVDQSVLTAVTSDASGQFRFNRERISAGQYELSIRAAGYELAAPQSLVITGDKVSIDLRLQAVTDPLRLASQLTSLDWVQSFPGTEDEKNLLVRNMVNCGFCHSLERIARSSYNAEQFAQVIQRMHTYETDHASADRIQIVRHPLPLKYFIWY